MTASDASLFANIDARTKLAGSNKMEILLFTLGTREIFGINVFKVREVSQTRKSPRRPICRWVCRGDLAAWQYHSGDCAGQVHRPQQA